MALYAPNVDVYLGPPLFVAAWNRTLTTSVGWATSTASAPVVIPAAMRIGILAPSDELLSPNRNQDNYE